ncbi:hypothetical protein ABKN59_010716 [Abortiporus biennis]
MDSEDERETEQRDTAIRKEGVRGLILRNIQTFHPPLRLYQYEELGQRLSTIRNHLSENWSTDDVEIVIHIFDIPFCRLRRFLHTVQGFHSGTLDLTGRHERRYQPLLPRWNAYLDDFRDLVKNGEIERIQKTLMNPVTNTPFCGYDGEPFMYEEVSAKNQALLVKFYKKWRLSTKSCSLAFVLSETDDVVQYLDDHPEPKFQTLLLHHLPPEIIHLIMEYADLDGARSIGATSLAFREISVSYIYKSRTLKLSVNLNYKTIQDLTTQEERRVFKYQALVAAKEKLIQYMDFLLSRPDILRSIIRLTISGDWDE